MLHKKGNDPKKMSMNLFSEPFCFLFFLLSSTINHLLTSQIYPATLQRGPDLQVDNHWTKLPKRV